MFVLRKLFSGVAASRNLAHIEAPIAPQVCTCVCRWLSSDTDSLADGASSLTEASTDSDLSAPKVSEMSSTHIPAYFGVGGLGLVSEAHLTQEFFGKPYCELPVIVVGAGKNNTMVTLADWRGRTLASSSASIEGFKNAKKQTNVAAQVTGVSIALKAKKLGIGAVRVKLRGIGRGRLPCLSGLAITGINIVSICDDTKLHYGLGRRAKKPRRV